MVLKPLWREPLVHFLAIGGALFLLFRLTETSGGPGKRIVVTPAEVERLAAGFARSHGRPPSESERRALVEDAVREEIADREARAMGLDREDPVVRRRLRQRVEASWEAGAPASPPTEAELTAWLKEHADAFRIEPQVAFRQIAFSAARRGGHPEADAARALARLKAEGPNARASELGDALELPSELGLVGASEVTRLFGDAFARRVLEAEPGAWTGPLESSYGLHLVFVLKRVEGRVPELSEVRPAVERELIAARRKAELDSRYGKLRERYRVVVEAPATPAASAVGR